MNLHLGRSRQTFHLSRFKSSLCGRIFDISDPAGRAELELIYWIATGLCMITILVLSAYYFVIEEVANNETARLIVLFSCSLSFVLFVSLSQFHLSTSPEVTRVGVLTDEMSLNEEIEKRHFYIFSTVSLGFYIAFVACTFNSVLDFICLFLCFMAMVCWQVAYTRFGFFLLSKNLVSQYFLAQYVVLGVLIFLSLLGSSLALVNFS